MSEHKELFTYCVRQWGGVGGQTLEEWDDPQVEVLGNLADLDSPPKTPALPSLTPSSQSSPSSSPWSWLPLRPPSTVGSGSGGEGRAALLFGKLGNPLPLDGCVFPLGIRIPSARRPRIKWSLTPAVTNALQQWIMISTSTVSQKVITGTGQDTSPRTPF